MRSGLRVWIPLGLLATLIVGALVGVWIAKLPSRTARSASGASREALASLPYLTWVPAEETLDKRGVTVLDEARAAPGHNLYASLDSHRALLVDMHGEPLHEWELAVRPSDTWQHVELLPEGALLAVVEERRLVALDRDSRLLWHLEEPVHHDVAMAPSGGFFVLTQDVRRLERHGDSLPVLSDSILRLGADGEVVARLDLFDLFVDRVSSAQWADLEAWLDDFSEPMARLGPQVALKSGSPADLFHANSVEVLPRDVAAIGRRGDLLISLRDIDTIAVVDFESGAVRWSWGPGTLRRQHHASLLDNDHLLVYDNRGGPEGNSRVVELEPLHGEIVWSYYGEPPEGFFSALRGSSQRLPNTNTLITESDRGRAFEVTPRGEVVWEYYNPIVRRAQKQRSAIYRMTRIESSELSWLD